MIPDGWFGGGSAAPMLSLYCFCVPFSVIGLQVQTLKCSTFFSGNLQIFTGQIKIQSGADSVWSRNKMRQMGPYSVG